MSKIIVVPCFLALLFSCSSNEDEKQKIGFMEIGRVFESYHVKKDYDELMKKDLAHESNHLDSLRVLLVGGTITDSMEIHKLQKDYYQAEQLFSSKYEKLSSEYTGKVNEKLNVLIADYAKKNGYGFILGSSGNGSVMYVDSTNNVTDGLITFINSEEK